MYDYIVILKGTNKKLACLEFEILFKTYFDEEIKLKQLNNIYYKFKSKYLIDRDNVLLKRLTFTNHLSLCKFKGNFSKFKEGVINLDLNKFDGKKFSIRIRRIFDYVDVKYEARELAKPIWSLFEIPKVDLEKPDIEFYFFFEREDKFFFCEKIFENDKDYLRRMPKKRPVVKPYTLKSDMARVAINYLGLKNGLVLDPFCGIGGILLEAKDMGFEIIGNDISWNDLKYMRVNFDYFFPDSNYYRILADSRTQFLKENSVDGIVTDIPYGRASRRLGKGGLYEDFLKCAKKYLKKEGRIVVIYANFVEFRNMALKYFDLVDEAEHFINRSMTRHIIVLRNSK